MFFSNAGQWMAHKKTGANLGKLTIATFFLLGLSLVLVRKKGQSPRIFVGEGIQDACVIVFVLVLVLVCVCVWPSMTTDIKTMTKRDQS